MMKHDYNIPVDDDAFDNFLSAQLQQTQHYLMDDNFTAQIMAKLPAAKKLSIWQERLIIAVPLLIISFLVISQFSVLAILIKFWTLLVVVDVMSLLKMGLVMSAVAVFGASFWFAKQLKLI
jgi:hypothetical protein